MGFKFNRTIALKIDTYFIDYLQIRLESIINLKYEFGFIILLMVIIISHNLSAMPYKSNHIYINILYMYIVVNYSVPMPTIVIIIYIIYYHLSMKLVGMCLVLISCVHHY